MSRVNILKRVKIGARWKLLSIPRNDKGNPNWAALPEGRYFIEWYLGGKRRREFGGTTVAQALESQKRKRHELEGRHLGLPGFKKAGEHPKNPPLHLDYAHDQRFERWSARLVWPLLSKSAPICPGPSSFLRI